MKKNILKQKNIVIGYRIKQLRLKADYTQNDVAERLGVSSQHYGTLERGINSCSLETIIKICDIYKIPITNIIGDLTEYDQDKTNSIEKLAYEINDLPQSSKDIVLDLLEVLKKKKEKNTHKANRNRKK